LLAKNVVWSYIYAKGEILQYIDNLIPSPEDFAMMAKEYSLRLKREKLYRTVCEETDEILIDEICYLLKFLNWLYAYTKRNVNSIKLKTIFDNMEKQSALDLANFENRFFSNPKKRSLTKPRKLNNLNSCIKLATYSEAELTQKLLSLTKYQAYEFIVSIANIRLEFIMQLSSL
jgi:hypothetical protein